MLGILEHLLYACLHQTKQLKLQIRMHITACWSEVVYQFIKYQKVNFLCNRSNIKCVVLFISLGHECISHLTLSPPPHVSCFFVICLFFQNQLFRKKSFRNTF